MPVKIKAEKFPAVFAGLIFLAAGVLKMIVPTVNALHNISYLCSYVAFFGIVFCWGIYIQRSILSDKIRRHILTVVAFMILYIFIGAARNRIFIDQGFISRFLWYLYYLPQIFATYLTFIIALRVGKTDDYKLPEFFKALFLVAFLIVAGFLTNDIHQLAFSFNESFIAWDQQYSWGPLFYVSTAWIFIWLIAGVVLLSVKGIAVNKKKAWIPVFWLIIGTVYILLTNLFHVFPFSPFNLPETHCFIIIAMLESSIRIGILPSNHSYGEIISKSGAAFQIAEHDNSVIYRCVNAGELNKQQMEQAKEKSIFIDKNTLLKSHEITGGYVYWTEDMTAVNEMNEGLSQISQSLSEEGDLLRAENEIQEQRVKIAEQTRLYNSISLTVKPQLEKISSLIEAEGDFRKNMAQVCILNCYVKRRANLTLLSDRSPRLGCDELFLSLKESTEYIRLYGGVSDAYCSSDEKIPSELILLSFDLWQFIVEALLPELSAVTAGISIDEENFIFRITAETDKNLRLCRELSQRISHHGGSFTCEREDSCVYYTLSLNKGGEEHD